MQMIVAALVGFALRIYLIKHIPLTNADNDYSNGYYSRQSLTEAIALHKNGFSPYDGGIYHGSPLLLSAALLTRQVFPEECLDYLGALLDVVVGVLLCRIVRRMTSLMDSEDISGDFNPQYCTVHADADWKSSICQFFYILNPVAIVSTALGGSPHNFLLSLFIFQLVEGHFILSSILLSLCVYENIYCLVLILPAASFYSIERGVFRSVLITTSAVGLSYSFLMWASHLLPGGVDFVGRSPFHWAVTPTASLLWFYPHLLPSIFHRIWYSLVPLVLSFNSLTLSFSLFHSPCVLLVIVINLWAFMNPSSTLSTYLVGNALFPSIFHLYRGYPQIILLNAMNFAMPLIMIAIRHFYTVFESMSSNYYFYFTAMFSLSKAFELTDIVKMKLYSDFLKKYGRPEDRNYNFHDQIQFA